MTASRAGPQRKKYQVAGKTRLEVSSPEMSGSGSESAPNPEFSWRANFGGSTARMGLARGPPQACCGADLLRCRDL
jgi:hypothetical protein